MDGELRSGLRHRYRTSIPFDQHSQNTFDGHTIRTHFKQSSNRPAISNAMSLNPVQTKSLYWDLLALFFRSARLLQIYEFQDR